MGVYKELALQRRDKGRNGASPSPGHSEEDPERAMATKLAWAVGSTLSERYGEGTPLKDWANGLAARIVSRHNTAARRGGSAGSR